MSDFRPKQGEQYIGCDTGIVYEWDGEKWVDTGEREEPPKDWIKIARGRK